MRKFMLVVFIGMVVVLNIYGIINKYVIDDLKSVDHVSGVMTVYVE